MLRSLREGLARRSRASVHGIINGTTNYVLSRDGGDRRGRSTACLKRAQELGYAEADPSFDVDGIDAAHKLALLTSLAFGAELTFKEIPTEGIRGIVPARHRATPPSSATASSCSRSPRTRRDGDERIEVRVHPTMIPRRERCSRRSTAR